MKKVIYERLFIEERLDFDSELFLFENKCFF